MSSHRIGGGKENKGVVGAKQPETKTALGGRAVDYSEATKPTSRTRQEEKPKGVQRSVSGKQLNKRDVSREAVKSHVSEGDLTSSIGKPLNGRERGEVALGEVELEVIDLAIYAMEDCLNSKEKLVNYDEYKTKMEKQYSKAEAEASKAEAEAIYQDLSNLLSLENAGGFDVLYELILHFDKMAEGSKDNSEEKKFYEKTRDLYENRLSVLRLRKNILESAYQGKNRDYKSTQVRVPRKKVEYLTQRVIFETNKMIWEKKGYCSHPKEKFSEAFSGDLSAVYSQDPMERGDDARATPYTKLNKEKGLITDTARRDFPRITEVITKEGTSEVKWTNEFVTHLDAEEEQEFREAERNAGRSESEIDELLRNGLVLEEDWVEDKIDKLLEFCGGDKEKLFMLSQVMNQAMGVDFLGVAMDSKNSPQKIGTNMPFRARDSDGEVESHYELVKDASGNITIKFINNLTQVKAIWDMNSKENPFPETDPEQTYYRYETGIVLTADNRWEEYKGGYLEFNIVKK